MSTPAPGEVFVGPAGWSYEDWKGTVYPPHPDRKFDPLRYLSGYFDLIEVNSTFYRPPRPAVVKSWAERIRDRKRFRFTVKAWRELTHRERRDSLREDARSFRAVLEPLAAEGRLGAILVQFPFWFRDAPVNRDRIRDLRDSLGTETPIAVELRHTSWLRVEPMTWLNELGLGYVNIDLPRSSTNPPPTEFATSATGYVRLHGRNAKAWFSKNAGRDEKYDYLYSAAETNEWVRRVKTISGKAQVTYVVTNNHFRGQAPANALQIMARLADRRVPIPPRLLETYPFLGEEGDASPEDPGALFPGGGDPALGR